LRFQVQLMAYLVLNLCLTYRYWSWEYTETSVWTVWSWQKRKTTRRI